jgi:tetratricopeptide (TPR) repeat protein
MIRDLRNGKKGEAAPANVTSLVQTRMSRLSDGARVVLWAASVLRANFDQATLAAAAGTDEATFGSLLAELEGQDLIAGDTLGVRFRHDLFRAAVDDLLVPRHRSELHRRARMALESRPHPGGVLERLAFHAQGAGDHAGALDFVLRAVRLAVRSSSLKTVRALYERASLMRGHAAADSVPTLVAIMVASIDALQQSGEREEYRNALEFIIAHAPDRATEGLARAHLALLCWMHAKHEEGWRHAELALEIARELDSLPLRALAQPHLANIEHARGNLDRAIALHTEIVAALEGENEASTLGRMIIPSVRSRAFLACFLIERGRFDDAKAQIDRGEEILLKIDQPYSRVLLNAARGLLALRTGNAAAAVAPLERARELCLALQFYVMEPCVTGWLASALVEAGGHVRAREIGELSIGTGLYRHGGRYTWVYVHIGLGEALFAGGAAAKGLDKVTEALGIAEESQEPIQAAMAHFARGRMRAKLGDRASAANDLRAALALAERHGLDPLAQDCRRALQTCAA